MTVTSGFNENEPDNFDAGTRNGKDEAIDSAFLAAHGGYMDRLGVPLGQKGDGYYYMRLNGKLTFKCTGSDKQTKQKTATIDASAIAYVPPAPGQPKLLKQRVTKSEVN